RLTVTATNSDVAVLRNRETQNAADAAYWPRPEPFSSQSMTAPGSSACVSLDTGGRGAAAPAGACRACGARAGSGVCTLAGSVACALGRGGGETCGGSVRSTAL